MIWFFLLAPATLFAAAGDDFYERLFARGMANFRSGDYQLAYSELHKAAFGFLENIEKFETAEIYAAIAAHRMKHEAETRDALLRIVSAENIKPHFRTIALPDALREEVFRAAAALLTKKEAAVLAIPEEVQAAADKEKTPVEVPTPTKRPNVAVTAPRDGGDSSSPPGTSEPQPAASTPAPAPPSATQTGPQPPTAEPVAAPPAGTQPVAVPSVVPPTQPDPPPPANPPAPGADTATAPKDPSTQPAATTLQAVVPMVPAAPQSAKKTVDARLTEAQQAVEDGNPARARSIFNALLRERKLSHETGLSLAEGLYRVRDFAGAIRAFKRVGALAAGEERYHYYYAVALFETGHFRDAHRELDAALPFIDVTNDVVSYRTKIEQAAK